MSTISTRKKRAKTKGATGRCILLDNIKKRKMQSGTDRVLVCRTKKDLLNALKAFDRKSVGSDSLWISTTRQMTDALLHAMTHSATRYRNSHRHGESLLTLEAPEQSSIPFLRSLFDNVIGETSQFKWLPVEQLLEVLDSTEIQAKDRFIGGVIDGKIGLVTLVRGNLSRIVVPLSIFRPSGTSKPDFTQLEIDDYGHSVRFGDYEASAHFILYEVDPEYRKRTKKRQRETEQSFGASLRRLRILKGVPQSGFPGINAKTIGRIESGEVSKPHGATLKTISRTLGVLPGEIKSY